MFSNCKISTFHKKLLHFVGQNLSESTNFQVAMYLQVNKNNHIQLKFLAKKSSEAYFGHGYPSFSIQPSAEHFAPKRKPKFLQSSAIAIRWCLILRFLCISQISLPRNCNDVRNKEGSNAISFLQILAKMAKSKEFFKNKRTRNYQCCTNVLFVK